MLLANDSDVDGDTLSITAVDTPINATVVLETNGDITFTPNANFNGVATFNYSVSDGNLTDTATVSVTVTTTNDAPLATADTATTLEDTPVVITSATLLANDTDADGDTLTITALSSPVNATVVLESNGDVTVTPNANFNGEATFNYTISDGVTTAVASVSVTVTPVNDAPVAANDISTTSEDTQKTITSAMLLANDSDVDGDTLSITAVDTPINATVVLETNGDITFTPNANFNGVATFNYSVSDGNLTDTATVSVTVTTTNDAPLATADTATTLEDTPVVITSATLLANDTDADGDTLTITALSSPVNATVVLESNGDVTVTPNANFNGEATFNYTISDGVTTAVASVSVTVTPVNDAPVAANDISTTSEDTQKTITSAMLLANDSDVDGDTLSITAVDTPINATVVLETNGDITFTPNANFNGVATFNYSVSDGNLTDTATVSVTVTTTNDAPLATADTATTLEDTPVVITSATLLANDTDADGDTLTITALSSPVNATVVLESNGDVTVTPNANFNGEATFNYTISDGVTTAVASVSVTVTPVNDAPVAANDISTASEDTQKTITSAMLLANDSDVDGDTLSITAVDTPINATVVLETNGDITFTPDANFNGVATFNYSVSDGNLSDTATVSVTVTTTNDAPLATADTATTLEDTPVVITSATLLANDTDADGDTLTITALSSPVNATVVLESNGDVTVTPNANFNGEATFNYTISDGVTTAVASVSVTVTPVNDAPVAANDISTTSEDTQKTITSAMLLANDSDVDGDTLSITAVDTPINATVVLETNGDITFTPDANFNGVATFNYSVSDGNLSDTATVSVTVTTTNDAPLATADTATTLEDTPVVITSATLLANDTDADGDTLTITALSSPVNATVVLESNGDVTVTPNANFNGEATFNYTISDGVTTAVASVSVTVTPVNDAPVAANDISTTSEDTQKTITSAMLLANDSDVDGDTLSITAVDTPINATVVLETNGDITFTPNANFNGVATFNYSVSDGNLTDTATVSVTVTTTNDAPLATADTATTLEDTPVVITSATLLANDTDADGDTLTITALSSPVNATVVLESNGDVTVTPNANFNGEATFNYTISDGVTTAVASVSVTVTPVNDAPVAANDISTTSEDTQKTITSAMLLANDSDVDGDTLSITAVDTPINATVVLETNGDITFTPNANFNGVATFNYSVSDGNLTDTATVSVTVTTTNDAPLATADTATTLEDTPVVITSATLLANDTDADGDTLTITALSSPVNATVVLESNGDVTVTPNANFNGEATFNYTISDGVTTAVASVSVTVTPVNDAPVGITDAFGTYKNINLLINSASLLVNDSDVDGDTIVIESFTQPTNGSLVDNANGTYTYTPNSDFLGADSFTYTINDTFESVIVTVNLNVIINAGLVATDDTASVLEDSSININVLLNDLGDTISIDSYTQAANGSLVQSSGVFTYTPTADFNGADNFTYTIRDVNGSLDTATVTVTVASINDAPVAVDDVASTTEDLALVIPVATLLSNDTDVDGDTLSITAVTTQTGGSVTLVSGDITFTPTLNFNGVATFKYTLSDGTTTTVGSVDVTVTPLNDAPVAVADIASVDEDNPLTITSATLLANDSDADGDTLSITAVDTPLNATVVLETNGDITFTPDANFNGEATFNYTLSDGNLTDTATVTVTVASINDAPVAVDDVASTTEDLALVIPVATLLSNDTDVDGDTLSITAVTTQTGGSVTLVSGDITFTPTLNFNGVATFKYTLSDGTTTTVGSVDVTVTPLNDAPVAVADIASVDEDNPLTITSATLLANDSDADGDTLSITAVDTPINATVVLETNGDITFTPDANFNGEATFNYTLSDGNLTDTATVTVTVASINDAPVAVDDVASTTEDLALVIPVATLLSNDTDVDGDTLSITAVTTQTGGSVTLVSGDITFTPTLNFNGVATFKYTLSDGNTTTVGSVDVTVTPLNDAPVAVADIASVDEDNPLTITSATLLANDSDADGDTLSITAVDTPINATVVLETNGDITFTPDANFNGEATFNYTLSDGNLTDTATVTVTVASINDAPVAVDDVASTTEDLALVIPVATLLSNDTDVDGDTLSITAVTTQTGGSVTLVSGDITFTPTLNFNGVATFKYTLSDGTTTTVGSVDVTVTPLNDAPVAVADIASVDEDNPLTITSATLLANDSDADGDTLSITAVDTPLNATVVIETNGDITFTPDANFNGEATFNYTLSDGNLTDTATVSVTVASINDAPVAVDDVASTTEDLALVIPVATLLSNDTDVDGDTLSITAVTTQTGGSVTLVSGDITFTPTLNFNGVATFKYTLSDGTTTTVGSVDVTVTPLNDAPVAVADIASVDEDNPLTITSATLLANDSDADGDTLSITAVDTPLNATVVLETNGDITFTPDANFNGEATFNYTLSDGNLTDTATVTVTVASINDAPVAVDDVASTTEDLALVIPVATLLSNDTDVDGDTLSITAVTTQTGGSVTLVSGDITFTPTLNFNGVATFKYTLSDGTTTTVGSVDVTVTPLNDAPVAVADIASVDEDNPLTITSATLLANDSDADGDTLSITAVDTPLNATVVIETNGDITFTPDANFNGEATFNYTLSDGNLTDTATVTVTVASINDAPVAVDDVASTTEDLALVIPVATLLSNDTDVDGDTLSITAVTTQTGGSVTLVSGDITFTPTLNFNGVATFKYTLSDGNTTTVGSVDVTVTPLNDAPVAVADIASVDEDNPLTITSATLLANDSDADGDTLSITAVDTPLNATVVLETNGDITFTPDANFNGEATFNYTLSDGNLTDTATVTVTVASINDAPVAVDDVVNTSEDILFTSTVNLNANDTDLEGDILTVTPGTLVTSNGGSLVLASDGSYTYTPVLNFNGIDTVDYTVTDGLLSDTGTLTITVAAVNDAPIAVNDVNTTVEDTPSLVIPSSSLLANDSDPDGDTISITGVSNPIHAVVSFNDVNGDITFTPNADFSGLASFSYILSDGNLSVLGLVEVTVTGVNDAPVAGIDGYLEQNAEFSFSPMNGTNPSIAKIDNLGGYVIVWQGDDLDGDYSIVTQKMNPDGTRDGNTTILEAINKFNKDDLEPQVTGLAYDGSYAVTWYGEDSDGGGEFSVFVQKFSSDGSLDGATTILEAPSSTTKDDKFPTILAPKTDGSFIVAFTGQEDGSEGGDWSVFIQRFAADGTLDGNATRLEPTGITDKDDGEVQLASIGSDGSYVAVWSGKDSTNDLTIYSQKFHADGSLDGNVTELVSDVIQKQDIMPVVTGLGTSGAYSVAWSGQDLDGGDYSIFTQKFAADGSFDGPVVHLEAINVLNKVDTTPSITALGVDGAYAVAWTGEDEGGDNSVYTQIFNSNGTLNGSVSIHEAIGTTDQHDTKPDISSIGPDGKMLLAWFGERGTQDYIYTQMFDANGTLSGGATELDKGVVVKIAELNNEEYALAVDRVINAGKNEVYTQKINSDSTVVFGSLIYGDVAIEVVIDAAATYYEATYTGGDLYMSDGTTYISSPGEVLAGDADASILKVLDSSQVEVSVTKTIPTYVTSSILPIEISVAELLANDTDADGDTLTITNTLLSVNGTVSLPIDGIITFIPSALGLGGFGYVVDDGNGGTALGAVFITIE
ncbi:tandem-95 repeat protein [Sulfurimonas aquatica]|uniref:Tandem-95 repeat protein n=2 Tax=Sulfurimonas aquatica TaxID=2672570 RepID=A0A975GDJ7_9BACT|nr:tandem-95 repeat protein [Sulfurimonas aquatica]